MPKMNKDFFGLTFNQKVPYSKSCLAPPNMERPDEVRSDLQGCLRSKWRSPLFMVTNPSKFVLFAFCISAALSPLSDMDNLPRTS